MGVSLAGRDRWGLVTGLGLLRSPASGTGVTTGWPRVQEGTCDLVWRLGSGRGMSPAPTLGSENAGTGFCFNT